ncbi:MASE3 domain-containing protein [Azospirillum sp.]|uniref:MASE3 domain-containing protein n=1 Tax=Azospirillum sp. TaxID=34012 RepID=UPI003D725AEA
MADPTIPATAHRTGRFGWAPEFALIGGGTLVMFLTMRGNYLLFHTLAELFSIVVATATFVIAWNTRHANQSQFLSFVGLSFPSVAVLDLLHTLSYKGMGVFPGGDTNLPTQLWIAARFVQAASFLAAPLLLPSARVAPGLVLGLHAALVTLILALIFPLGAMPDCFVEGQGLTDFKIASEYAISGVVALACMALWTRRRHFEGGTFPLALAGFALLIVQEMTFTLYQDPHGLLNAFGHFIKIVSYYLLYRAIVVTALQNPYDTMFLRLCRSEQALRDHLGSAEAMIAARTAELRESEARWKALLDCSNDWFWATGTDGRFTEVSPRAREALGRPSFDLIGRVPADLLDPARPPDDFPVFQDALREHRPFRRLSFPVDTTVSTGCWLMFSGMPRFSPDGVFLGFRGTASDITERRRAAEAARQKQTMAALGGLVGGLAHEINNLLQPVISLSDLALNRAGEDARLRTYLTAVRDSGMKARIIMRDVLAFARTEVAVSPPASVGEAVRGAVELARPDLPPGIRVLVGIDDRLPAVTITATELSQILLNLIRNACDAMPTGGTLTLSACVVTLRDPEASRLEIAEGDYVRLTVADTGTGMDEATRQRVFEPFFTTKPVGLGTGLGLSVVYGIVRNGGGVIAVDSAVGRGTAVMIDMPMAKPAGGRAPGNETTSETKNEKEPAHGEHIGG